MKGCAAFFLSAAMAFCAVSAEASHAPDIEARPFGKFLSADGAADDAVSHVLDAVENEPEAGKEAPCAKCQKPVRERKELEKRIEEKWKKKK